MKTVIQKTQHSIDSLFKTALLAVIATFAVCVQQSTYISETISNIGSTSILTSIFDQLSLNVAGGWLQWFCVFAVMLLFFGFAATKEQPRLKALYIVASCLVSGMYIVADLVSDFSGDLSLLFGQTGQLIVLGIRYVSYSLIVFNLLRLLEHFTKRYKRPFAAAAQAEEVRGRSSLLRRLLKFLSEKPFVCSFVVITLCWTPTIIFLVPGTLMWDGLRELQTFFSSGARMAWDPPLPTLVMGAFYSLGLAIENTQLAMFFYVLIQCAITIAVLSWSVKMIFTDIQAPFAVGLFALCFYSLFSVFPVYAMTICKDSLFYVFLVAFALVYLRMLLRDNASICLRDAIFLVAAGLLTILYRNNGLYIVLPSLIALPFVFRGRAAKIYAAGIFAGTLCIYLAFNSLLFACFDFYRGSKGEALSIPFQQTARLVTNYADELSPEEREAIDGVLVYDELAEKYNPEISDPVKSTYRFQDAQSPNASEESEALTAYFSVWAKGLIEHPGTYLMATVCNTYKYYYTDAAGHESGWYEQERSPLIYDGEISIDYYLGDDTLREILSSWRDFFAAFPLTSLFYSCGLYTFVFVIAAALLFGLKKGGWRLC